MNSMASKEDVHIPVSRTKALTRGVVWGVCMVVLGLLAYLVYSKLSFASSVVSSRLVDVSVAIVASPILLGTFYCFFKSMRWLLLCSWPASVGVFADSKELVLLLGSFGNWRFDAPGIEVKYPFELSSDLDGREFESFLPEQEQRATLLPRIMHPQSPEPIDRTIQRYVQLTEAELASRLRNVIDAWRDEGAHGQEDDAQGLHH